jgi:proteic killer suppression protein
LISKVYLSKQAKRDLEKIPLYVVDKFIFWVKSVESTSVEAVRILPGFHDEPLKGSRIGMRSIRLSRSYRAFYRVVTIAKTTLIQVEEINKHDY